MTNVRTAAALTSVAAIAALAACSPNHVDNATVSAPPSVSFTATASIDSSATSDAPTPCALATSAEVGAAFGGSAGAGTPITSSAGEQCEWKVTGTSLAANLTVVVFYPSPQSSTDFDTSKTDLPGTVQVSGVGDGAYYVPSVPALTGLVGQKEFTVQVRGATALPVGPTQTAVITLAKSVATTLG